MDPLLKKLCPPSPWVVRFSALITGDVLDIACGNGRHTRYFADQGHKVTALDRDISGLADLKENRNVELIKIDLEKHSISSTNILPKKTYNAVIVTNYLWRPLMPHIISAVDNGGILIYETFSSGNEAFGKPNNPEYLLKPAELLKLVDGKLNIIAYESGVIKTPRIAVIQRICAIKQKNSFSSPQLS
jgi:SAM-dependent methyltransferase